MITQSVVDGGHVKGSSTTGNRGIATILYALVVQKGYHGRAREQHRGSGEHAAEREQIFS